MVQQLLFCFILMKKYFNLSAGPQLHDHKAVVMTLGAAAASSAVQAISAGQLQPGVLIHAIPANTRNILIGKGYISHIRTLSTI